MATPYTSRSTQDSIPIRRRRGLQPPRDRRRRRRADAGAVLKVWEERGVALRQGYGMTETSPAVLTLDREDAARKAGSSGKPVLHTEVRIVRPDGTDAGVGELGELWVKGPNITPGY